MRLRLYHHPDGTRIAYREAGTGPGLGLFHSAGLTHREFEPLVEHLSHRFRLVLPDLPAHGDSEDRPRLPYTPAWLADVIAAFCAETLGPRPLVGGHGAGAELLLRAIADDALQPSRLVLMSNRLHSPPTRVKSLRLWRSVTRLGALPGLDRMFSHGAGRVFSPSFGIKLSSRGEPAARDLLRHAFADVPGNANRARAWARLARSWPLDGRPELLDLYPRLSMPVLLLWADQDHLHPLAVAEEALQCLPSGQLRVLSGCGHLLAYDDPVGVARELTAFCGSRGR